MAVELTVNYLDVNGETASNTCTVADMAAAVALLPKLKKLTNAAIVSASISTPVDISGVNNNTASNANNESAKFKMAVQMKGPKAAGATAAPSVKLEIPAPVGTYVNAKTGDPANADIQALLAQVLSNRGEALNTVKSVKYMG